MIEDATTTDDAVRQSGAPIAFEDRPFRCWVHRWIRFKMVH